MLRFGKIKVAKEELYGEKKKKTIKIWDVDVKSIVISKLIETKNNSKYLNGYLDEVIKPVVLVLPKVSGYVKTFKGKSGDTSKNSKLLSLLTDDENLLKKFKNFWTKIEDLQNIELNALPVYNDRYKNQNKNIWA